MADTTQNMDGVRAELNRLRDQIEAFISQHSSQKAGAQEDLMQKLQRELEYLRSGATERAHKVYEAGQAGVEQVETQIRRNPLLCVAVAFGAGCLLGGLFRR